MRRLTIPRRLYNFFHKRPAWTATVLTLPILYEKYGGKVEFLPTPSTEPWVTVFSLGILSFAFLAIWIKSYADRYDSNLKENGQRVISKMLEGVNAVVRDKLDRFVGYIGKNHGRVELYPFNEITQPREQIKDLLINIQTTLAGIFGISRDEIDLSLIYWLLPNQKWDVLYALQAGPNLQLEEVLGNRTSTVYQLISGDTKSVFYPDKRTAIRDGKYLPGPKDHTNSNIGSILCRDVSIQAGASCVRAILSINTYGNQICEDSDIDTIAKVENIILPCFEERIRLELSLLYIKEVLASSRPT
jgi:hypothetical protein